MLPWWLQRASIISGPGVKQRHTFEPLRTKSHLEDNHPPSSFTFKKSFWGDVMLDLNSPAAKTSVHVQQLSYQIQTFCEYPIGWWRHRSLSPWNGNVERRKNSSRNLPKTNRLQIMSSSQVNDKNGEAIKVGDTVSAKARGGKHTGQATAIVTTKEDAEEKGVKNPPKVLYEDQHGTLSFKLPRSEQWAHLAYRSSSEP